VLVTHPATLLPKYLEELGEIGSNLSLARVARSFQVQLSKEPLWLTENLVFLGEIERYNNFEALQPLGKVLDADREYEDYLWEDSALAYRSARGMVIITGCSHAGICNIVEQAKKVCQEERVLDIIGGFHLLDPSTEQLQGTINYMKELGTPLIHACHCTDLASKLALSRVINIGEVGVGTCFSY
jgi:7,8-dihydropterin-6-yl-methyl-4-(beta-D-ribofuranosyl)aminobenzene 5'-phosphate synthase